MKKLLCLLLILVLVISLSSFIGCEGSSETVNKPTDEPTEEPTPEPTEEPDPTIDALVANFADTLLGTSCPETIPEGDLETCLVSTAPGERTVSDVYGIVLLIENEAVVFEFESHGTVSNIMLTHDDYAEIIPMALDASGSILFPAGATLIVSYDSGDIYEFTVGETIKVLNEDGKWVLK